MKAVCYYVSGHGLGHASRATQVMAQIPASVPLIVKTHAPESFVRQAAGRPMTFIREAFDVGVKQVSNVRLDWPGTFRDALKLYREKERRAPEEIRFWSENNVGTVVCDVSPLPLRLAAEAGIPGVAVVNFTWVDIYRSHAKRDARAEELVRLYTRDYRSATLALRTPMSLPMRCFQRIKDIPLIARTGTSVRRSIFDELGIPQTRRLVLLYLGTWDDDLERIDSPATHENISYIAMNRMPGGVHVLDNTHYDFADVVASVDAVLAKPGYGTMGECMANGTPVVYYPRPEFAEYAALRNTLQEWGGAIQMSRREFLTCRWRAPLEKAFALRPSQVSSTGAAAAAAEILNHGTH